MYGVCWITGQRALQLCSVPLDVTHSLQSLSAALNGSLYTARSLQNSRRLLALYLAGSTRLPDDTGNSSARFLNEERRNALQPARTIEGVACYFCAGVIATPCDPVNYSWNDRAQPYVSRSLRSQHIGVLAVCDMEELPTCHLYQYRWIFCCTCYTGNFEIDLADILFLVLKN